MALEAYLDSIGQLALPLVATTHETGGLLESLGSSLLLQRDRETEAATACHLDVSSRNLSASIARMTCQNANWVSDDVNPTVFNNYTKSIPSIGASSLVIDANLPISATVADHMRRSGSTYRESYLNSPYSPLSFSSNNLSAPAIDASSIAQPPFSHRDQNSQLAQKRLLAQHQVDGTAMSQRTSHSHTSRLSLPSGKQQEPGITQKKKKPRLDVNPENILHQQIIQQLLQKQGGLQDHNQLVLALMQQHEVRNQQQQVLQSIPQFLGVPMVQQQQMRHHLQQQANQHISVVHPHDGGICSRRLMQYMYHLHHRPPDNSIDYWRKFVAEYFAPGAKKRWCLSLYDNVGEHNLGVFTQATMEAWQCDICGSKPGKGFEANFEVLPRLSKIKFESGVIDELLFLDCPYECRFPSGIVMLSYGKAVQETVYEQFRVVREGQLRIIFSHNLKILSWEFCAQHHEVLVPRRLVAPQVNQLIQVARKYQNTTKDGGSDGVSAQELQLSCNMFAAAGRQLTHSLESLLVNDLGFSKRYVRCLQIAEVVNSMKDLITFSLDNNIGPLESLKKYPREKTNNQIKQLQEMEWLASAEGLLTDQNKKTVCPSPSSNVSEHSPLTKDGIMTGLEKPVWEGIEYYHKLLSQNSNSPSNAAYEPCSISSCSQSAIPSPVLAPQYSSPGTMPISPISDSSTPKDSRGSKNLQQLMIRRLLQDMMSDSRAKGVQILQNANGKVKEELPDEFDENVVGRVSTRSTGMYTATSSPDRSSESMLGGILGRRESFKAASNNDSSSINGNRSLVKREPDLLEKFCLTDAVQEMDNEFFRNGAFNDDGKDMCWKS